MYVTTFVSGHPKGTSENFLLLAVALSARGSRKEELQGTSDPPRNCGEVHHNCNFGRTNIENRSGSRILLLLKTVLYTAL